MKVKHKSIEDSKTKGNSTFKKGNVYEKIDESAKIYKLNSLHLSQGMTLSGFMNINMLLKGCHVQKKKLKFELDSTKFQLFFRTILFN